MKLIHPKSFWPIFILIILSSINAIGQKNDSAKIEGLIKIDSSWSPNIYLSFIPTFEDIHAMSNEMIIAESRIDNKGKFEIDLDFLPEDQKLYRLHITKKGDFKTSLIIGGLNENYIVFIADRFSKIKINAISVNPPFKYANFLSKKENLEFQKITNLIFRKDSIVSRCGISKRKFVEKKYNDELLSIADSATNNLVSLYALYKTDVESGYIQDKNFYKSYIKKWSNSNNEYFKEFKKRLPIEEQSNIPFKSVLLSITLILTAFIIGKTNYLQKNRIKKLSVQERKILDLLKRGATNKEISDEFNIGLSTVKSHVSSILNKLKVKSRKEIMNLK